MIDDEALHSLRIITIKYEWFHLEENVILMYEWVDPSATAQTDDRLILPPSMGYQK